MIYYGIVIFIYLGALVEGFFEGRKKPIVLVLYFLFVVLGITFIGAGRYNVGSDFASYKTLYDNVDDLGPYFLEPGYLFVSKAFTYLNYPALIAFMFLLTISLKAGFFLKNAPYLFIPLMCYIPIQFMVYDINGIRQGLAISILFCSIPFILDRSLFKFLLICGLAMSFHITAIIFIPIYWFATWNLSPQRIAFSLLGLVVFAFLSQKFLAGFLESYGGAFSLLVKMQSYSKNEAYNKVLSFNLSTFYRIAILFAFMSLKKTMKITEEYYKLLQNGYFLSLIVYFFFFGVELIATRGSLYFRVLDVIMFSYMATGIKDRFLRQVFIFLIFVYTMLQVFVNLSIEDNELIPYHHILFNL